MVGVRDDRNMYSGLNCSVIDCGLKLDESKYKCREDVLHRNKLRTHGKIFCNIRTEGLSNTEILFSKYSEQEEKELILGDIGRRIITFGDP